MHGHKYRAVYELPCIHIRPWL